MKKTTFILGTTGSGKTYDVLTQIVEDCHKNPTGEPKFIITPEQMTFHTEYQLLRMSEKKAMIRTNVTSFNRLAHRIMQENGGLARLHLDEVGKAMLLTKIMQEQSDTMGMFKHYAKKPGFVKKIDELFSEFKHYQLEPEQLKNVVETSELAPQTKVKLKVLANLFEGFNQATLHQYLTTEDYFDALIATIGKSALIKSADIYIDGYHTFNGQELAIIQELATHAKSLTIVLTAYLESTDELWATTRRTYENLRETVGPSTTVTKTGNPAKKSETLTHLAQQFRQNETCYPGDVTNELALFNAVDKEAEIEEIAIRIHELTHRLGNDFTSIAIYTNNPSADEHLFKTILTRHNIPYFLDYTEPMMKHPVIGALHKVFDIFDANWRMDTLFTLFKTGLFVDVTHFSTASSYQNTLNAHMEDIDALENYCLARNIKKHQWQSGETFYYGPPDETRQTDSQKEVQEKLTQMKNDMAYPLITLEAALKNAGVVKEFAVAIFEFLETLDVPKKLQLFAETAKDNNEEKEMKEHEQVWSKLLQILEQIVEVAGSEPMASADFVALMKTGLENLTYATTPATLNGVQIGDITRSRYQLSTNYNDPHAYGISHAFIMGMNDGVIPSTPAESSLLSESERLALGQLGMQLAPDLIQTQKDEIFSLYTIMAATKTTITFSYTTALDGVPSYLIKNITDMFEGLTDETIPPRKTAPIEKRLTTQKALFHHTLQKINSENQHAYDDIINYFSTHDEQSYARLKQAIAYDVQVEKNSETTSESLNEEVALTLYGTDIEASVSRIELFNKCEFAHFMTYGLKAKERTIFELTVADIGNLYHEALRQISNKLKQENRSFSSLSDKEIQALSRDAVETVVAKSGDLVILNDNARMQTLKRKLLQVVVKTLTALTYQNDNSGYQSKDAFFELKFQRALEGYAKHWIKTTPKQVGNVTLSLKGVIDRLDVAKSEGKTFARIVDYKSREQQLRLDAVLYGQSLQLLTYLDVAMNWLGEETAHGGALYFHLHNPYLEDNSDILTDVMLEEKLLGGQKSMYKMNGYLPDAHDALSLAHVDLPDGLGSDVVPLKRTTKGLISKQSSRVLAPEDFDVLRRFTTLSIEDGVKQMSEGAVGVAPKSYAGASPCQWCKYQSVCQFEGKPKYLKKIKEEVALEMIKARMEGGGEDGK